MPQSNGSGLSATFQRHNSHIIALTGSKNNIFDEDLLPDTFLDVRHILAILPVLSNRSDCEVCGSTLWVDSHTLPCKTNGYIGNGGQKGRVDVYESPGQIAAMMGIRTSAQMQGEKPQYTTLASGQRLSGSSVPDFLSFRDYDTDLQLLVQRDMIVGVRLHEARKRDDVYLALNAEYAGNDAELNVVEDIQDVLKQWGAHISPYLQGVLDGTITSASAQAAQPRSSIRHWTQKVP